MRKEDEMKIIAALALAVSLNAHAALGDQNMCANLADIGRSAATANSRGISEANALSAWSETARGTYDDKRADALFEMGVIEIRAVYQNNIINDGEGYWTGYAACMRALK
jgi:hypothetical protein